MFSEYYSNVGMYSFIRQASVARFRRVDFATAALIVVKQGHKKIHYNGIEYSAIKGRAIVIDAKSVVDVTNIADELGPYEAEIFVIDDKIISDFISQNARSINKQTFTTVYPFMPSTGLSNSLDQLKAAFLEPASVPNSVVEHKMTEILLWLQELGFSFRRSQTRDIIYEIKSLISGNCEKNWKTSEVAQELGYSESTLRRRLKEIGASYTEIVSDVKMMTALALLQGTDQSITEISYAVGYQSASKFALRFRNRFDLAPRDIRSKKIDQVGTEFDLIGRASLEKSF